MNRPRDAQPEGLSGLSRAELEHRVHHFGVLNEFAVSLLRQRTVSEVAWDVVKSAIARLGFEDCVVYLLDHERGVLKQAAAHGPKSPETGRVLNPIEIPVGDGVVGAAAATGTVQRVADTRRDGRYIVDDQERLSELAVPMIYDGTLVGVIDSEHSEPNYYTDSHVEILQTVASMTATRIAALQTIAELRRTVARLSQTEQRLARQTEQLRAARDRAEGASRAKSAFVAGMSHEVRSPLAAILGYADQMSDELDGSATESQREALVTIQRSGRHLLSLVNDILDMSKLEAGQLQIDSIPVDLRKLVDESVAILRGQADERGIVLAVSVDDAVPAMVATDPTRLRQILLNLIGNAIKFAAPGTPVSVSVAQPEDGILSVEVADQGDGIDRGDLNRIFDEFEQLQPDAGVGVGLGLPISRLLARLLGGDLTARSDTGSGSVFSLEFRVEPSATPSGTASDAPSARAPAPGETVRVLVADDSHSIRRLVRRVLERSGFAVTEAEDGRAAVEAWKASPDYQLILLDMRMPGVDGYQAARELRDHGCEAPIVALTAHAMRGDEKRCRDAGCSAYLTKPFELDYLVSQVRHWIDAAPAG